MTTGGGNPAGSVHPMSTRPRAAGGRARRTWLQRLAISLNVFVVLACLTTAVALTRYSDDVAEIERISGSGMLDQVEEDMEPRNFLLVGVDNAEDLAPDDPVRIGRNEGSLLSDTILVLRVDPDSNRAWMVSFPRDLRVELAGSGSASKINAALPLGGPDLLIETIQSNFGIPIHHYAQVNFQGFRSIVDIIDGVPMWFEHPARDDNTGLLIEAPGCITLDEEKALQLVRSRYFQNQIDGRWVADQTSDYGRVRRQQVFIQAALGRAIAKGARNPIELERMIEAANKEVVLDDQLSLRTLLDIGEQFRHFDPNALEVFTLPTTEGSASSGFLILDEAAAQPVLDVFRGNNIYESALALVRAEVRNGTGQPGEADRVADELAAAGFTITGRGDAATFDHERTVVRYQPGYEIPAVVIARYLAADVVLEEAPEAPGAAPVMVVTGPDWSGLLAEPRPIEEFAEHLPEGATVPEGDATDSAPAGPGVEDAGLGDSPTTSSTVAISVGTPPPGTSCG